MFDDNQQVIIYIDELPDNDYILVTDSQDTQSIKDSYPDTIEFDSFFVLIEDGDYKEIWGFMGIIPYLNKRITRII